MARNRRRDCLNEHITWRKKKMFANKESNEIFEVLDTVWARYGILAILGKFRMEDFIFFPSPILFYNVTTASLLAFFFMIQL